ncbi:uncharacterized protein LOC143732974 isoform X2 [Siphateles boraxobius]|uniref:uncharacterized protein LOC143732974 isoform X2 n=1 Tax=Siphateles boraxobius TaxID=180520 RepID=UPI004063A130
MRRRPSKSQRLSLPILESFVFVNNATTNRRLPAFDEASLRVMGVIMKSTPSPPPAFVRVSERDLTEIELHSVDSINDLHRTHSEQHSKGVQPPRPPPPSSNGNLQMQDRAVVYQTVLQSSALHTLLEMVKQKQETAEEISQLLQLLQQSRDHKNISLDSRNTTAL